MNSATSQFNVISSAYEAARVEFASGGSAIINRKLFITLSFMHLVGSGVFRFTNVSVCLLKLILFRGNLGFIGALLIDHFVQFKYTETLNSTAQHESLHTASANCKLKPGVFMLQCLNRESLLLS